MGALVVLCVMLVVIVNVVPQTMPERAQRSGAHIDLLTEPAALEDRSGEQRSAQNLCRAKR